MKYGGASALAAAALLWVPPAAASESMTFKYDALGRLSDVATTAGPNEGSTTAVRYDPAGNRTSYSGTGSGTGGAGTASAALSASSPDGLGAELEGTDALVADEPSVPTVVEPPAGIPDEQEPPTGDVPSGTDETSASQGPSR